MTDSADQERVFAFLSDPARHPDVQRIDTHAASVFLEGDRALKIKRAVRFPFLDYSTLEKRKAACEEEIRINRPAAPQIYRRVVAVTEARDGSLCIGGNGTPIEYGVEMFRFDQNRTLDCLAKAGPIDSELAASVAVAVATSHAIAPPAEAGRWIASIPDLIDGNTQGLCRGARLDRTEIEELGKDCHDAFRRIRPLLEERGRRGFVRRCHGDLHLANIVLLDSQPVLFDAIEFDPDMASTDVLYDLAFPLMDLQRYGQAVAANALLNRYLAGTVEENLDALSTLPLFLSTRAAIRAQVSLARLSWHPASNQATILEDANRYFQLARTLIHPPPPRFIAIGGLSGTGKSVLARALAPDVAPSPGAVVLRSDVVRKQLFGVDDTERLPDSAYDPEVTRRVYDTLARRAQRALKQGHSAIVDAVFAQESERIALSEPARQCQVPLIGFFLVTDLRTRQERIERRRGDASDATEEIVALQEHYDIGAVGWTMIDASDTPERTLERCRIELAGQLKAI